MKLVSFAADNYRGIRGGLETNKIDFDNSNAIFIFGQNNVGKSSFLRAYGSFYDDTIGDLDFPHDSKKDITVEIWLKVDEASDKDPINEGTSNKFNNLKTNFLDSDNILKLRKTWLSEDGGKKPKNQTYNAVSNSWEDKAYGGIGFSTVFQPLLIKPLFINAMPTEKDVENIVTEVLKEAATKKLSEADNAKMKDAVKVISDLQDEVYKKETIDDYKKEVNEKFNALFGGYSIEIDDGASRLKFTTDKIGRDFKVSFKDSKETINNYAQMGHGAVRMAIFLLMLMRDKLQGHTTVQKNFLVLFEEPELFLHPTLTKKLRSLIYEVSEDTMPFQILCASHSPQMIDLSKEHTSLARMTKAEDGTTKLMQIKKEDLKNTEQPTADDVKQKIYELLRFDPFICESFYADEVLLVEGDTEAIIGRGYQQISDSKRDVFIVNCHSCTNIPFYQKIFSKFNIPYSVICDTDHRKEDDAETVNTVTWDSKTDSPSFGSGIQKAIADQFYADKDLKIAKEFLVFPLTFEPCHKGLAENIRLEVSSDGKPYDANNYWLKLSPLKNNPDFKTVPIISYLVKIGV